MRREWKEGGELEKEADKILRRDQEKRSRQKWKERAVVLEKLRKGEKLVEGELATVEEVLRKASGRWGEGLDEDEVKELLKFRQKDVEILHELLDKPDKQRNALVMMQALKLKAQYTLTEPKGEGGGDVGVQVVVNTLKKEGYGPEDGRTTFTVRVPQKQLRRGDEEGEEQA